MKKKLLALALSAAMTLSLAACGDSGTPAASGSGSAGSDGQTFTVGVCQLAQHPALDAATQGFVDALKAEFGDAVDVQVQNAGGEVTNCSTPSIITPHLPQVPLPPQGASSRPATASS